MSTHEIPEKDKPFYLAVISSVFVFVSVAVAAIGAYIGNSTMAQTGMDSLKATLPLTTMAWTFYFQSKS